MNFDPSRRRILGGALAAAALASLAACTATASGQTTGKVAPNGAKPTASTSAAAKAAHRTTTQPSTVTTTTPPATPSSAANGTVTVNKANQYAAAVKVLHQHGYDPMGTKANWHSDHQLNAIAGVLHTSGDGKFQHLFFFVNGRYIGMDQTNPSAQIQVANTSNNLATATYGVFKSSDALCCPSSTQSVRFQWNGSKLVPIDPLPSR